MEATSLYIHTCMGSLFPNIHAMRYDGWFFVVVVAFLSFAKREIFSRKQVSIGIVPVYIKDITQADSGHAELQNFSLSAEQYFTSEYSE